MTFTGKVRSYLILIAVLPPLAVLAMVYWQSEQRFVISEQQQIQENLHNYDIYREAYQSNLKTSAEKLARSETVRAAVAELAHGRKRTNPFPSGLSSLDFAELIDNDGRIVASQHRPGLIGEKFDKNQNDKLSPTIEFDINGRHAAWSTTVPLESSFQLCAGKYIDSTFIQMTSAICNGNVSLIFDRADSAIATRLEPGKIYKLDSTYQVLLEPVAEGSFGLLLTVPADPIPPFFATVVWLTSIIGAISILIAVLLGFVVTGRARKEIENLRQASQRISTGDFDTPVMAYDEGEFSELADALTEMSLNLKRLQRQLSTSEKIAAWQTMGRKMAHEVKNPLSPIAISADDLRRSWAEKQPNFESILNETTSTIKEEVTRLTKLLDQFVSFARMAPPTYKPVPVGDLINRVEQLYRNEVNAERLIIEIDKSAHELKPEIDSEQIGQVLINLIKNGLESSPEATVSLTVTTSTEGLRIGVSDSGPGFSDEILADSFRPYLSTKPNGSGLGLIICQRIVIDHGGTIELFNEPEGGAGVTITLPIQHG